MSQGGAATRFFPQSSVSRILMSVPKNLAFLIPEILARLAIAGRAKTLPVPPVGEPVRRREEEDC